MNQKNETNILLNNEKINESVINKQNLSNEFYRTRNFDDITSREFNNQPKKHLINSTPYNIASFYHRPKHNRKLLIKEKSNNLI